MLWGKVTVAFELLGGFVAEGFYRFITKALGQGKRGRTALGATYFCFYVFSWLNGDAIVQLFHIPLLIGFAAAIVALHLPRRLEMMPSKHVTV